LKLQNVLKNTFVKAIVNEAKGLVDLFKPVMEEDSNYKKVVSDYEYSDGVYKFIFAVDSGVIYKSFFGKVIKRNSNRELEIVTPHGLLYLPESEEDTLLMIRVAFDFEDEEEIGKILKIEENIIFKGQYQKLTKEDFLY